MKRPYKSMAFAAALCTTVFASCQKINESDLAASAGDIITKTLPVSRELWTSEATKSTYEEGVGLYLTGDEHISVFYSPYVEGAEGIVNLQQNDVEAFPAGDGKYTFSHDAIEGAESYNYYFLMPYTQRASANSDRTGMSARLSPDTSLPQVRGEATKGLTLDSQRSDLCLDALQTDNL